MSKFNGTGLITAGVLLLAIGLVLRWELIDWLIDAVGFMFIAGGVVVGIVGLISILSNRKRSPSAY